MLEEDKTYLKVRTPDGAVGYVLRQYISSDPPKTKRIADLERLNNALQKKVTTLETTNKQPGNAPQDIPGELQTGNFRFKRKIC